MTDEERLDKAWREAPRLEIKRRLQVQLKDFRESLPGSSVGNALLTADLCWGTIGALLEEGLLTRQEAQWAWDEVGAFFDLHHPEYGGFVGRGPHDD